MAYLKTAKVGQIISVPGPVVFASRMGSSRYYWADAIVREVYQAKGGLAVVVEQDVQGFLGQGKYLVSQCKKCSTPNITAEHFEAIRGNKRSTRGILAGVFS